MARFEYEVVTQARSGAERRHEYATDEELGPGSVLYLDGRSWLVERLEATQADGPPRAIARPGRYRVRLVHPDGREEPGAIRRQRPDAPTIGHSFATTQDGQPVTWEIVGQELAFDDQGDPFLDLRAERDYTELDGDVPYHELEHARATEPSVPEQLFARAAERGLSVELVSLEPGVEPDWNEAGVYIDALGLEEINDDLVELCGVRPNTDPRETWIDTVKERLRSDLEAFRADVDDDHDQIEEWDFLGGRVFASTGSPDDEADPNSGHGWLCRLFDSGVLTAAGFHRVRKAELDVAG